MCRWGVEESVTSTSVTIPPGAGDSAPEEPGLTTPWGRVDATSFLLPAQEHALAQRHVQTSSKPESVDGAAQGEGPGLRQDQLPSASGPTTRKPSATGHLPSKQSRKRAPLPSALSAECTRPWDSGSLPDELEKCGGLVPPQGAPPRLSGHNLTTTDSVQAG